MFTKENAEKFGRSIEKMLNDREFDKARKLINTAESLSASKSDPLTLRSPLEFVPGLSAKTIESLEAAGITTVGALLHCRRKYLKSIDGVTENADGLRAMLPKIESGNE